MRCPFCGAVHPVDLPHCPRCNSEQPRPTCPRCGRSLAWGEAVCPSCTQQGAEGERVRRELASGRFLGRPMPTVGRDAPLQALTAALDACLETGSAGVVTLVGSAGIGKSRLAAEFQGALEQRLPRYTLVHGVHMEGEAATYSLYRSLLADRLYLRGSFGPAEVKERLLEGVRAIVGADAAEELTHLIGYVGGLDYPESPVLEPLRAEPQRLEERAWAALARLFRADAADAPLILVLDDLHLASEECLALTHFLAERLNESPVLFLCLAQPSLFDRSPAWGQGAYRHHRIELQPLSDAEVEQLFAAFFPRAQPLPQALLDLVAARALGNPLVVERIARILVEKGVLQPAGEQWEVDLERLDPGQIPGTLNAVVRARLEALTDDERQVLQMASVVGTRFWVGALEALQRMDADRWPEEHRYWRSSVRDEQLQDLLRELEAKDLLRATADSRVPGDRELSFKHRIERDILYQQLSPERRAACHRRVAAWLELGLERRTTKMLETLAQHHESGGNPKRAAHFYLSAAQRARERHRNPRAIQLYQQALALLGPDEPLERIDLFHDLGNVYALTGDHAEALCYFREMLGQAWLLADRRKGAVAYEKMGQVYRSLGEYSFAMEQFQKALRLFQQENDQRGVAATLDDIGRVHWMQGEIELALANHRDSLALRRSLGDPRSIALALAHIGGVLVAKGKLAEAMQHLQESLELRRSVGDRRGEAESLNAFGAVFFGRGYFDRALTLWQEASALCDLTGDRETQAYLLNNMAEAQLEQANLEGAAASLARALDICNDTRNLRSRATVLWNLGRLHQAQGDSTAAQEQGQEALAIARRAGLKVVEAQALSLLAQVESDTLFDPHRDTQGGAEAKLRRAVDLLEQVGDAAETSRVLRQLVQFLEEAGRGEEAGEPRQRLQRIEERLRGPGGAA